MKIDGAPDNKSASELRLINQAYITYFLFYCRIMSYLHLRLSLKQSLNSQVIPAPKHEALKSLRRFCGTLFDFCIQATTVIRIVHSKKKKKKVLTPNHMTFFLLQKTNVEIINSNVLVTLFPCN